MRTLFLFGAGASYGSEDCQPYCPPLGDNLYDELCSYSEMFKNEMLDFAESFRGKGNFERGMIEFANKGSGFSPYIIKIMGGYFFQFVPGPNNLYKKLIQAAMRLQHAYVFATLNYDILLEVSAGQLGYGTAYSGESYSSGQVLVVKPHGSCNTVPVRPSNQYYGNFHQGFQTIDEEMRYSYDSSEIQDFLYRRQDQFSPAMSFYAPSKTVAYGLNLIKEHYQTLLTTIYEADQIVIIGVTVNPSDDHIWGPLARTQAKLVYFGRDLAGFREWSAGVNAKSAVLIDGYFDEAVDHLIRSDFIIDAER